MQPHRVDQAVVLGGKVSVTGLPFPDGERVQVVVTALPEEQRRSISDVRNLLRGGVERFDLPFEPAIPEDSWEMLK